MPAFVTFGRVLFAVLFMYTGATKLFAVQQTADFIATKVTIPAMLAPYASQIETMAGMPMPQILALAVGGFEILAGLMIAVNFGARFSRNAATPSAKSWLSMHGACNLASARIVCSYPMSGALRSSCFM